MSLFGRGLASQGVAQPSPLTLLAKEGRRVIPVSLVNDQEFVALDDLAPIFQLTVREESLALTVSYKGKLIVLTSDQGLASVAGKLVSLPAPPTRAGRRWLVPLEFISRALAPVYDTRLELRKPSHLLIAGDLRVPQVTVRYESVGTTARLTVDATPRATSTVSQDNDRLAIKFDADALDIATPPLAPFPPQGVLQAIRALDPVTLGVDLGPRFAGFKASTQPVDQTMRLVIDLLSTQTQTETTQPVPAPSLLAAPAPDLSALNQPVSAVRTIAIDPGHGGDDEGAKGDNGVKEKDVTLSVARRVKASIEARLGIRVMLTRDDDRNVPLDERTAVANNNKADLFISLHASASLRKSAVGASIFSVAFDQAAEETARLALAPERLPTFNGGLRDIELVPWDLAQIGHIDQSIELATILRRQFQDRIALSPRPVERAPLRVLESANMPAVLIEMGYLTNPDQEKQLAGAEFQNALVQAVFEAVLKFRDALDQGRLAAAGGTP